MKLFTSTSAIFLSSLFILMIFLLTIVTPPSFAFRLGDADPLINNIWLEPENPEPGDIISIQSSIYNQGTQSTKAVTNIVTIGYFIDGNLVKISQLTDVRPGIENGIEISTGPIWLATDGVHTVTVILNYHDTLSHLTDNFENNIMQKKYYIGNWKDPSTSLISFDLFQETIPDTQNQLVKIVGKIILPENYPKYTIPRIAIEFIDEKDNVHKFSTTVNEKTNSFYWREIMPVSNTIKHITASLSDTRYSNSFYQHKQNIYPINLKQNESLFVLKLPNSIESNNFKNQKFSVVIYDELYQPIKKYENNQILDYPIKKIETIQLPASPFKEETHPIPPNPTLSTSVDGDFLYFILPGDKTYNFEIYSENKLKYSALKFLEQNKIVNDVLENKNDVLENKNDVLENKNSHHINLNPDESTLSLQLPDSSNHHNFRNSEYVIVVWQTSYDNLFKQISTSGNDDLILTPDEDLLIILPGNNKYIVEIYLDGALFDAFETFLKNKEAITRQLSIPETAHTELEVLAN